MWRDDDDQRRRRRSKLRRDDRDAVESKYKHGTSESHQYYQMRGADERAEKERERDRRKVANPRNVAREARKERQRERRVMRGREILREEESQRTKEDLFRMAPRTQDRRKLYAEKFKEGYDRGLEAQGVMSQRSSGFSNRDREARGDRPGTAGQKTIGRAWRGYRARSEAERRREDRGREEPGQGRARWGGRRSRKRRGGRTKRRKGRRRRCPKTGKPICYCKIKKRRRRSRRGGRRTRRR